MTDRPGIQSPTSATRPWTPVLAEPDRPRALSAAREMGETLVDSMPDTGDPSLSRGLAGTAVALHHLASALDHESFGQAASSALEKSAGAVATQRLGAGLMQGFTGIAWAVEHLNSDATEDPCAAIDEALIGTLSRSNWPGDFDLVSGLVGLGSYALERLSRPRGEQMLELVVGHLDRRARRSADGIAWFTEPRFMPPEARQNLPDGYFNAGVAHGVPGVAGLLAGALDAGVSKGKTEELLAGAVDWMLAHRMPPGSGSTWPYHVATGAEPARSRLAWCYGDPGVSIVLVRAGEVAGRDDWIDAALAAADSMLQRDPDEGRVDSASLCHGSAGVAHIYARLHHLVPDHRFVDAARAYLERALSVRDPARPMAGYSVWIPGPPSQAGDVQGPGLLAGVAGIALALAAAATDVAPSWDRFLLLSGPTR